MFLLLFFVTFILTLIVYIKNYSYWYFKGIPSPLPLPFFGNIFDSFSQKRTVGEIFRHIYGKYDTYPAVGVYRTSDPVLIVRDPELISRILIKDAKAFFNNDFSVDKKLDPMQGASPFVQKNQEWKETRVMLSPGFTSGKIKTLFTLTSQILHHLSDFIEAKSPTIDTQNLCRRYTLDNVALSAFGIDGHSFLSEEADFMRLANSFIAPGTFALSMLQMFPMLSRFISLKVIPKEVEDGLTKIITEVLQYRKKHNIQTGDYLQFISDLAEKNQFDYAEVAAHAATFFEDGYETSALVMSYALYNLSQNPQAQQKLRKEIRKFEQKSPEGICFEDLNEMTYLNACISESMRLNPVLEHYTRVCNERFKYTSQDSPAHLKKMCFSIDPGTICVIPFGGLCHDGHYFPDAEMFIPERFLDKERNFKAVFLPFGGGHRYCLGQRFGIMQVRMGIIEVIKKFQVKLSSRTKLPFRFRPWTILNKVQDGVWLEFEKI